MRLGALDFVAAGENVAFLGPPGTGKTHLAIGIGIRACEAGHRAAFTTASEWVGRLIEANAKDDLALAGATPRDAGDLCIAHLRVTKLLRSTYALLRERKRREWRDAAEAEGESSWRDLLDKSVRHKLLFAVRDVLGEKYDLSTRYVRLPFGLSVAKLSRQIRRDRRRRGSRENKQ